MTLDVGARMARKKIGGKARVGLRTRAQKVNPKRLPMVRRPGSKGFQVLATGQK